MSEPLISVVIPCYNHGQYIDEAIKSVEESKYQDFEIIIINPTFAIRRGKQENLGQFEV